MEYVIGIDSGGTKIEMVVCSLDGKILYRNKTGSGNIVSAGIDEAIKNMNQAICAGLMESGLKVEDCKGICAGTAGISVKGVKEAVFNTISGIGFNCEIKIINDIEPVVYAYDGDIMVVAAGTGSYAYGRTFDNRTAKAGGYGYIIGDECGGFDIAIRAIKKILMANDCNMEPDNLTARFCSYFGVNEPRGLINAVYDSNNTRAFISNAARIVYEEYLNGSHTSYEILADAAKDLLEYIMAVAGILWNVGSRFTVVLCGGVMLNNLLVREIVIKEISGAYPLSIIKLSEKSTAEYAAELALRLK